MDDGDWALATKALARKNAIAFSHLFSATAAAWSIEMRFFSFYNSLQSTSDRNTIGSPIAKFWEEEIA